MKINRQYIHNIIVILLLIIGIAVVLSRFVHLGHVEYTDNATVCQHITPINARIQGYLTDIRFDDYQYVHEGDTLALIDTTEFYLRLLQVEADFANAQAAYRATNVGKQTLQNNVSVSDAGVERIQVELTNAEKEKQRYLNLLQHKAVTQQQYDEVHTQYLTAKARYDEITRLRITNTLRTNEQNERLSQSEATIRLAQANIDIARLNLSYCTIIATANGYVSRKQIHIGQLIQPGQILVSIIDDSEKWIDANYRESQLQHIHVGSEVKITADAVPNKTYHGIVESLSAATGSATALIPVDNTAGNFVKVEQRLPVRIRLTDEDLSALKVGYNVECKIKY